MKREEERQNNNELMAYVELTGKIRELSSPQADTVDDEEDYRRTLLDNFLRIGEIARANGRILENFFMPLMEEERELSEQDVGNLRAFGEAVMDARNAENLDQTMVYMQAERLLKEAEKKGDIRAIIRGLDDMVAACGAMAIMTLRLYPCSEDFIAYRQLGMAAARKLMTWLNRERFAMLPSALEKETVLINARYMCIMFQRDDLLGDEMTNASDLETLMKALALADDAFYREQVPDYNWHYHVFRSLQYICNLPEYNNIRRFSAAQLKVIASCAKRLSDMYDADPEGCAPYNDRGSLDLIVQRAYYLSGTLPLEEYRAFLLSLSDAYDDDDFSHHANLLRVLAPFEYIMTLDREHMSAEQEKQVASIYRDLLLDLHRVPKKGTQMFLLGDIAYIMKYYADVPGGLSFENFCLEMTAAIHPPTYVHVLSVADFTVCITRHLLKRRPELFVGMPGYDTLEDVLKGADNIIGFANHAALCHDVGKLFIVETIITYGRPLFDCEFGWIKTHPEIGAFLLEQHATTRRYANVARGHHRWYNNGGGYPESYDFDAAPDKVIVAIVECADCLDASTDSVGRSYKTGKSFEDFLSELQEGAGTRYAPYLAELLALPEVQSDIRRILKSGRDENYRKAYRILEGLYEV